jgi:hypothetical protein
MTIVLERVRKAISDGAYACDEDIYELRSQMPTELQRGLWRLVAGVVATYHSNGGASVRDWMGETVEEHLRHAMDHCTDAYWATNDENNLSGRLTGEDELLHVDHAACRIAMAFAREMMVK